MELPVVLVNYWRKEPRPSDLNLVVARVGLAAYAIWKLLSYHLLSLEAWPAVVFDTHPHGALRFPPDSLAWMPFELGLALVALVVFATGRMLRTSSFLAAVLIAHMVGLHYVVSNSGTTFLPAVYLLLLFGLFAEESRPGFEPQSDAAGPLRFSVLRWGQLILALTYFFTGYAKLANAGLAWAEPANLALILHREAVMHLPEVPPLSRLLIETPWFAGLSAAGTLILECGFLPALLLGLPILPFALGLLGMHTLIALTMGIFFLDQYLLFALFLPWDRILGQRKVQRASA